MRLIKTDVEIQFNIDFLRQYLYNFIHINDKKVTFL